MYLRANILKSLVNTLVNPFKDAVYSVSYDQWFYQEGGDGKWVD